MVQSEQAEECSCQKRVGLQCTDLLLKLLLAQAPRLTGLIRLRKTVLHGDGGIVMVEGEEVRCQG